MVKNSKVGIKLVGGAWVFAMVVAVGTIVGFGGLKITNDHVIAIYGNQTNAVQPIGQADAAINAVMGDVYKFILVPQLRTDTERTLRDDIAAVNKQMAVFRATTLDREQQAKLAEFDTNWKACQDATNSVLEQVKAGRDQAALASLTDGSAYAAHIALTQTINELDNISLRRAADEKAASEKAFVIASTLALGGGILGVIIALVAGVVLSRSISMPLTRAVYVMQQMGKGRLGERLHLDSGDEIGIMARTMDKFADDLQNMLNGNLERIAAGDLSMEIRFFDEHDEIARAEQKIVQALRGLTAEIQMLVKAGVEGKLTTRGNPAKFQGVYKQIVEGMNASLEQVIGPLNIATGSLDGIAAGTLSSKLTGHYPGDFAKIQESVNHVVEMLQMRNADIQMLLQAATEGQLAMRADTTKYRGANGNVLAGINSVLDAVVTPMKESSSALAQVARGDLTVHLNGNARGDYAMLKQSIETMIAGLQAMAAETQQATVNMSSATAQILSSSTQMASTTQEQASAVNQITSTVHEIKASAEQVAQRAQGVASAATQATQVAHQGIEAVSATIGGMDQIRAQVETIAENILALSEKTQQIGDIIETVRDIAGQSNILALNAAIEAAQAGEAGKGFRVVADEVRSLSEQSRQAALQVKVILGDIQKATNLAVMATEQGTKGVSEGTQLVSRTATTIQELSQVVEHSAQAAQQIVAGVEQQTIGLDQIAIGMADINQAAQQSAAGARQSQKAAQGLNELATQLKAAVGQYRM